MARERATFTVDVEILRELDSVAKELKTTRSRIIVKSLFYFLDYRDVRLAEKRLAKKKDTIVSLSPIQ